jgi:hypothetical protein
LRLQDLAPSSSSGNYQSASSNVIESAKEGFNSLKALKSMLNKNPLKLYGTAHTPKLPDMQKTLDSLNAVYPNPRGKNRFSTINSERLD